MKVKVGMTKFSPRFLGRVKSGHILVSDATSFQKYLSSLPELIEITVKPRTTRAQRSNSQNKYYFGVVISLLSEELGYTPDECHEIMKSMFLSEKVSIKTKNGDLSVTAPKSTSSLTTSEMEDYLEKIRHFAATELGISIPTPNETEC